MSSIPTKQINGDVAVGRNVTAGGNANIRGSVTLGHNLIVKGWLDAPNIKGPAKGLFKNPEQLHEAYPTPQEGWWALVGDTLPAHMYISIGGAWVAQNNADGTPILAGNPTVDSAAYMETVEKLTGDLEATKIEVGQNTKDINAIRLDQTTQSRQIRLLQTTADLALTTANSSKELAETAKSITDTKGLPNGIAPLDPNGIVPAEHLPDRENVVEFGSIVSGVELQFGSSKHSSTDAGCMVVYDKDHHKFLLAEVLRLPAEVDNGATVQSLSTDSEASDYSESGSLVDPELPIIRKFKYYPNWQDGDSFGSASLAGRVPKTGKLYVLTSENKIYHWSGTELEDVGTGLALGHLANSAYPGDEGVETNKKVDVLRDEFDSHVLSSERRVEELQDIVDSYADPVLMGFPMLNYRLGKIPLVSLNGVVDDVSELEGRDTEQGTTNYYFVRREKAIYWVDAGYAYGPWRSISTMGGAPIMITDALFVCKNCVYSFDGETLHRLLTTADLGSVVPASLGGVVKRRHIMLTAEPGNVYRNYNNYIKISSHADTLYTLKQGDVFRVDLNGFYAGNGGFCKPLSECVIACVGKSGGSQATEFEYEIEDNGVLRAVWPYEEAQLGVAVCLQVATPFNATKHSHVTLQRTSDGKRIFTFLDSYDETEVSLSSDFEWKTYLDIKEKKLYWSPAVLVQMWGWRRGVWKWRNIKNGHAFHPRDSFILRVRRRTRKARVMSEWIVLRCMLVNGKWELRKA